MTIEKPTHTQVSAETAQQPKPAAKTIVIYSPDKDFCKSLGMALQDFCLVETTNSLDTLSAYVAGNHPNLIIVDASPTENIRQRFELMKQQQQLLRIMMLYVSRFSEQQPNEYFKKTVDAVFYKPADPSEIRERIYELV